MTHGTTWKTVEEATSKYCLETSLILKWAEEGVIRAEQQDTRSMQVNADDIEHRVRHGKNCNLAYRDCD